VRGEAGIIVEMVSAAREAAGADEPLHWRTVIGVYGLWLLD
jgi:hypothetical protein